MSVSVVVQLHYVGLFPLAVTQQIFAEVVGHPPEA